MSAQLRLAVVSLVAVAVAVVALHFALQSPWLGLRFAADEGDGLRVVAVEADSPNAGRVAPGDRLLRMADLEARASWVIEEPDNLPGWGEYNALIADFNRLDRVLSEDPASAVFERGPVVLTTRPHGVADLPVLFWVQIGVGVVAFLIAAGVQAFRPRDAGAIHFAISGLGMLLSACSAAVYSSRELVIGGDLMRFFSATNWLGTLLFTAALAALLWAYPKRAESRFPLVALVYGVALATWAGVVMQLWPTPSSVYWVLLGLFSLTFALAAMQWRKTAGSPVERAALKWYLLSIYIGTGLFAAAILVPVALGIEPVASQGMMFLVFLFMFVGIAFGITRYRLFDLDRWWLAAWSWFLGGVLVICMDLFLVWLLGLGPSAALAWSLLLVGWLWFPMRQYLLARIYRDRSERHGSIQRLVQTLFSASDRHQLGTLWQRHLAEEWAVLEAEERPGNLEHPVLADDAQTMRVPHLLGHHHLALRFPQRGGRLFQKDDLERARLLLELARQALAGLTERQQAEEERRRILGDLHDDVGSKLLSLLYQAQDRDTSELAREALHDLRELVSRPEQGNQHLAEALADWRAEAQGRLESAGLTLQWQQGEVGDHELPVFRLRHMARILREALNNVIRHANAKTVRIQMELDERERLHLAIHDDGNAGDPEKWLEGRGLSNIRHRLKQLGGSARWRRNAQGGCSLSAIIPLQEQQPATTP